MAFVLKRFFYLIKITRNLSKYNYVKAFSYYFDHFCRVLDHAWQHFVSMFTNCIILYSGVTLEFRQWWAPDRIFRCTNSFRIFFRGFQRKFSKRTFTGFFFRMLLWSKHRPDSGVLDIKI